MMIKIVNRGRHQPGSSATSGTSFIIPAAARPPGGVGSCFVVRRGYSSLCASDCTMGMSSSRATRAAFSFSVIVPTTANPSKDIAMDTVSGIDVAEGRPSSDLIEATIATRGLRTGR